MKILITTILFASFALSVACGAPGNAANSNKSNSNGSNSAGSASSNSDSTSSTTNVDKNPINKEAFDFFSEIKDSADPKSFIGRSATVTELDLKKVTSSNLQLGYSWYYALDCEGSFSDYMSVADVVEKRDKDGKPVKATVKGVIKEADASSVTLDPCVLTDVKK